MQKLKNSERSFFALARYAISPSSITQNNRAWLMLFGVVLSCSLPAHAAETLTAGNLKSGTIDALPKIAAAQSGQKAEQQAKPEAKSQITFDDNAAPAVEGSTSPLFQATVEQSIQAARKRKMRELVDAERAELGKSQPPAPTTALPANATLPSQLPVAVPEVVANPRLWSLAAIGTHVSAEVWLDGKIIQLESMGGSVKQLDGVEGIPMLGSWAALKLTSDGLFLSRPSKATGKNTKKTKQQELLLLRPPSQGISISNYRFLPQGAGALSDSAQRATQLPYGTTDTRR